MSNFSEIIRQSSEAKKPRTGSDFVKLADDHQTIIRILDESPVVSWSHWVPKGHKDYPLANNGRGISIMCPGGSTCPICAYNAKLKVMDPKDPNLIKARKVFSTNVLDRTPVVTCPSCGLEHYKAKNKWPTECECGEDLTNVEPAPREKFQILQKGITLFGQFEAFENDPDFGDLREYDIKIDVRGSGKDSMITCTPKQHAEVDIKSLITDTNKPFNIEEIVKPLNPDQITSIIEGSSFFDVVSAK